MYHGCWRIHLIATSLEQYVIIEGLLRSLNSFDRAEPDLYNVQHISNHIRYNHLSQVLVDSD
jgi:hypothetical protein